MIKVVSKTFKDKYHKTFVLRAVCVAKRYDSQFMNRKYLENLMVDQVTSNIKLDLIIEDEKGFSVLWTS
jgi:hypothetical protein